MLEGFAKAGQNFPKSFQVFLTYPFVDEAVGRDPQVARNLHMGDYTNLSVNLDINAGGPGAARACPRSRTRRDAATPVKRARAQADRRDRPAAADSDLPSRGRA